MVINLKLDVEGKHYTIVIERKSGNRNTYIRVKPDSTILVTAGRFVSDKAIERLIEENYEKLVKMIKQQEKKEENNQGFHYLGRQYDIVYVEYCDISFGNEKVFLNKKFDIDNWYRKQANQVFLEHLNACYERFSKKIPYPDLKIRRMRSRWGVCNTKTKTVTLNLELIKRDTKYLDYVIIHELSHLIHPNHSAQFWTLVGENMPEYKKYRKEMREF